MNIVGAGTTSKLKIRAIEEALRRLGMYATIRATEVNSTVRDQPFGFEEMCTGASYRAHCARQQNDADFGVGIESGLVQILSDWYDVPCVAVYDRNGQKGMAFGAALAIPRTMVEKTVKEHTELGHVIQEAAGGGEKDPHKWLSAGDVSRDEVIIQAILCAFAPLLHDNRYA